MTSRKTAVDSPQAAHARPSRSGRTAKPMMFRQRRRPLSPHIIAILDFILPASYHQSPDLDLQRRGRILVAMNVCFFFVAAFYGAVMILMDRYPLASVLVLLSGCVLVLINLFLVVVTRMPALPGVLLCFELLVIQGYQAYNWPTRTSALKEMSSRGASCSESGSSTTSRTASLPWIRPRASPISAPGPSSSREGRATS